MAPSMMEEVTFKIQRQRQRGLQPESLPRRQLVYRWSCDRDVQTYCSSVCSDLTVTACMEMQSSVARDCPRLCKLEIF